jgi:hypothetical protein
MGGWRKSTHSDANGGNCVEVADAPRAVLVRDTNARDGVTLTFTADAWAAFTRDLPQPLPRRAPLAWPTGVA